MFVCELLWRSLMRIRTLQVVDYNIPQSINSNEQGTLLTKSSPTMCDHQNSMNSVSCFPPEKSLYRPQCTVYSLIFPYSPGLSTKLTFESIR